MNRRLFVISLIAILCISVFALVSHRAKAEVYNFGETDTMLLLKRAFNPTSGHDHDGVNSKGTTFPASYTVADDNIIVGSALNVGAVVPMSGNASITHTGAVTVTGAAGTFTAVGASALNGGITVDSDAFAVTDATGIITLHGAGTIDNNTDLAIMNLTETTIKATGNLQTTGAFIGGTQDLTTSSADPGIGAANLTTLTTFVTTDATGSAADVVSLAAGTKGQIKIITLVVDGETSGCAITPAAALGFTSVLLEDAGDSVTLVYDGAAWNLTGNIGGTVS